MPADTAYRLASEGTALLWQGDFQNARQLLNAVARRTDRKSPKKGSSLAEVFHLHRQFQSQRARILNKLLITLEADYRILLPRAPDIKKACTEAYGLREGQQQQTTVPLRELLGIIGAHEWRKKGVFVPALNERIHPHYGVFAPVRSEYVNLVAEMPLPSLTLAFDVGTGTGVLAAVLAKRGVARIIASDQDPRALTCAIENLDRLGFKNQVAVVQADLFPEGRAPLIVCNPPWIPARPSSPLEHAIYDLDSQMLLRFLNGLASHLEPNGEGWLLLSDLAEHLGLRSRDQLLKAIENAGLKILGKTDIPSAHPRTRDESDPLYTARAAETTSLWRLGAK